MLKALSLRVVFCMTLIAGMALSLNTIQAKSLDDILKDGVIRIGINPNFPPSSSRGADGEWVGFDIEIGKKLAEALKVKVEWVPTETKDRVPFLVADTIDMSLGALTRNSERAKLIEYTVPLHTEVLAALTTDKVTAEKWQDLNNSNITLSNIRSSWVVDWQKENMPEAKQEIVDTIPDVVRLVAQGRADAIIENIDFFMAHTKSHPNVNWKVLKDPIFVGYCAIGVAKGNYGLRDVLNIILFNLHSSNTVNELWEKAYGAPMLVKVSPNPYF